MCLDIVADGAISTGNVYVQPQKTGVLYNAYLIKAKSDIVQEKALFFIATIIQKTIKQRYGYENKAGWSKIKMEKIKLPIDKTGTPDYEYMANYMKTVWQKTKTNIARLSAI